ncbi:TATA element modulatory factor isoform X1 [Erpetoichthys calabaricus]|uniref:TATA element modulatory factor isoform X1 n=1 Tax=Erpetoichthys calabaricus TaxID=27687 RepID=UPI002234AFA0|nr:TATA element modulatory factor isoform X1 [Erpetoichthys calabaricus]
MSWFNASQLSSFAKQALSTAQKSIDRVLDIKEEDQWGDVAPSAYADLPGKSILTSGGGGWAIAQWTSTEDFIPPGTGSNDAITTPVTRMIVDESESFFSAFLPPSELQGLRKSQVVSVAPTKSDGLKQKEDQLHSVAPKPLSVSQSKSVHLKVKDNSAAQPINNKTNKTTLSTSSKEEPNVSLENSLLHRTLKDTNTEQAAYTAVISTEPTSESEVPDGSTTSTPAVPAVKSDGSTGSATSPPDSPSKPLTNTSKYMALDSKDPKSEDRQSNTPSPPVSNFSSGTSTTSDIEVLDHESVLSESSASSRQEATDSKASLHLMQTSFQLLSASACPDFQRLEDYQKLTESCSSSDAFERIDSFSVQSMDSRSVSEINSDDEMSGRACTLASVTNGSLATAGSTLPLEEEKHQEELNDSAKDKTMDENEMEESGRSATPVNSDQPEELLESQEAESCQLVYAPSEDTGAPERHLVLSESLASSTSEKPDLQKVIDDLKERLEKREAQLLAVSKDKARLEEECDNLKDELVNLKEEGSSVDSLRGECTQRIADAEKKAQMACKERDAMKKELKVVKEDLSTRLNSRETTEMVKEKEEQIRGLLEEGEKLSKQQLHNSNIIKKLRAKEKENETLILKQSKKVKDLEDELNHLQQVLECKEEVEKQHRENIKKLNSMVERQEKEVNRLQADLEELMENNRSLQAALDNSYKQLAELHRANATKDSEAQEAALSREVQAKEQLSLALERAQEEARQQQEALAIQVADLRVALQRAEQQQARKEDFLREEIKELQQRLQGAETRNEELSQSVTSATRPLLRQIENLQATLGAQTSSWEKLEKNLSDRLADAQAQLAAALEKERAATEDLVGLKVQLASTDSQNSVLRQEKGRLTAQLESEKARRERLEDESGREHTELENLKAEFTRSLEESKKEKMLLTSQLEMEKVKVEQEKKKLYLAQEAFKEKDRKILSHPSLEVTASPTPSLSRSSSVSGSEMAGLQASFSQDDALEHSFGSMTMSVSGSNLYDAVRLGAGSSFLENLQSQLKLREGEIVQLQLEISNLEKTRSVMAEELVKLTNQNDELEEKVKEIPKLRSQLRDLDQRYNTILQMYGEKAEEAEELRLDLEDVKVMYKSQIDELLKNKK